MTDRELLEAAAKAVGKIITGWNSQHGGAEVAVLADGSFWQPLHENHLTDCMGDALRLAVKLNIAVKCHRNAPPELGLPRECAVATTDEGVWFAEASRHDIGAATRRAITRAAAALRGDAGGAR